jgi:hypothetical protein
MQHMVVRDINGGRCFHLEINHIKLSAERALRDKQDGIMAGTEIFWYVLVSVIYYFSYQYFVVFPCGTSYDARRIEQNWQFVVSVFVVIHIDNVLF